jgi:hypothetical protein
MKKTLIALVVIIVLGFVGYLLVKNSSDTANVNPGTTPTTTVQNTGTTTPEKNPQVIGASADGRDILAYHYGTGENEILFVGGIHGGYEWNTSLVAYQLIDALEKDPGMIPDRVKVTVIPVLNPDGLNKVVGTDGRFTQADVPTDTSATIPGRFNGNNVDLNRNFDCDWQATGVWQKTTVSGGSAAFSEPESQAIRDYVAAHKLSAVVVWYSSAGGVYASNCHTGISLETRKIMNVFANASGYPAYDNFNFYETTGDMTNWLAKSDIPAISVILTNHYDTEWIKNENGIKALLFNYAE